MQFSEQISQEVCVQNKCCLEQISGTNVFLKKCLLEEMPLEKMSSEEMSLEEVSLESMSKRTNVFRRNVFRTNVFRTNVFRSNVFRINVKQNYNVLQKKKCFCNKRFYNKLYLQQMFCNKYCSEITSFWENVDQNKCHQSKSRSILKIALRQFPLKIFEQLKMSTDNISINYSTKDYEMKGKAQYS